MPVTEFQMEVLGRVSDDYEAISTIHGDIERDLGRTVLEEEVASALLALVAIGLVDAFVYYVQHSKYQRVTVEAQAVNDLWFYISQVGRSEYESSEVQPGAGSDRRPAASGRTAFTLGVTIDNHLMRFIQNGTKTTHHHILTRCRAT